MFANAKASLHNGTPKKRVALFMTITFLFLGRFLQLHRVRKKEASSFSTKILAFLDRFLYFFCIIGNRNEYSMMTCNLLTY